LQKFNYVALQTDTEAEDLYKAFVKVRAGVADIASGTTSTAAAALQSLKLDFNSFDGSEEQFYAIVDALSNMSDQTQMVAAANDIFGDKLANNILPLIYAGTDAVKSYCDEYDELGALTDEQVAALAEFDNVLNKIKTQLSNVAAQIGASLLPIMQTIADLISNNIIPKLQTLAEWFNSLTLAQQEFALKALLVVAALAPVLVVIGKLTTGVGSIIKIIPKLMSGLSALAAHPIILIIAAIVAVLVLLYTKCEAFREAINNLVATLGSALQPVLDVITGLLSTLMQLLSPIIELLGGILATVINLVVTALQPFIEMLAAIFSLIEPLINIALLPLQLALSALSVPLQALGVLLGWLAPLFTAFANIVRGAFVVVINIINYVLGAVETAINWCIGKINALIDGVNSSLGWLGVNISRIGNVSLKIDTSALDKVPDATMPDATMPDTTSPDITSPDQTYDSVDTSGITGDTYNYDNSTTNTTQNVTVTIQNYAEEVDVDNLVRQINIKLAEAM
jgi:phage-related protein